ncbi:MAG: cell division protein ZapA [Oscillospiraceae bacterium]|nr:cell division protein ZapA [Oscillospiraceae bacterium]
MMQPNKVRIEVYGVKFVINSTESPDYVKSIGKELDDAIRDFMSSHPRSSLTDAYLISLLDYADRLKKSEQNADHLRAQLSDYLEESARAHIEVDEYKREIDKLKREINLLRQSGAQPKSE